MTTKKRGIMLLLILLLVINMTALATLAYNRWFRIQDSTQAADTPDTWNAVQKEMALSPPQIDALQSRRMQFRDIVQTARRELAQKRIELLEEVQKESPDLEKIDGIIETMGRMQTDIQKQTVRNILRDKDTLNRGQRQRYMSLFLEQAREQVRGRGNPYRGRRGAGRWGGGRLGPEK